MDRTRRTPEDPPKGSPRVPCRRLGILLHVWDHLDCPYCFGFEHDVRTGRHELFCGFVPGREPPGPPRENGSWPDGR